MRSAQSSCIREPYRSPRAALPTIVVDRSCSLSPQVIPCHSSVSSFAYSLCNSRLLLSSMRVLSEVERLNSISAAAPRLKPAQLSTGDTAELLRVGPQSHSSVSHPEVAQAGQSSALANSQPDPAAQETAQNIADSGPAAPHQAHEAYSPGTLPQGTLRTGRLEDSQAQVPPGCQLPPDRISDSGAAYAAEDPAGSALHSKSPNQNAVPDRPQHQAQKLREAVQTIPVGVNSTYLPEQPWSPPASHQAQLPPSASTAEETPILSSRNSKGKPVDFMGNTIKRILLDDEPIVLYYRRKGFSDFWVSF